MTKIWGLLAGCLLSLSIQAMEVKVSPSHDVFNPQGSDKLYIEITLDAGDVQIQEDKRRKLNLSLVLDRSGSMGGEPIENAKLAAMDVYSIVGSGDILSLVTYSDTAHILLPPQKNKNIERAHRKIKGIRASGNTALYAGVEKGAQQVQDFYDTSLINRVILLSDGLANTGPSSLEDLTSLSSRLAQKGISVSTIGLGLEYDEEMMMKIAQKGDGNHYYVQESVDLQTIFSEELALASKTYAQDLRIKIILPEGFKIKEFLNYEGQIIDNQAALTLGQLMAEATRKIYLEVGQINPMDWDTFEELPIKLELEWKEKGQADPKKLESEAYFTLTDNISDIQKNEKVFQQAQLQKRYEELENVGSALKQGNYSIAVESLDEISSWLEENEVNFEGKEELMNLSAGYQEALEESVEIDDAGNVTVKDKNKIKGINKQIYQDSYRGKKNIR